MAALPSSSSPICQPAGSPGDPLDPDYIACDACGGDALDGWHDQGIVEIQVECPNCHREIAVLSGYLSLAGFEYEEPGKAARWINGHAWEIALGRDFTKRAPHHRRSVRIEPLAAHETRKFELVCTDQHRCRFRRVVGLGRTSDAMVAAWRKRSHRIVAGIDL